LRQIKLIVRLKAVISAAKSGEIKQTAVELPSVAEYNVSFDATEKVWQTKKRAVHFLAR